MVQHRQASVLDFCILSARLYDILHDVAFNSVQIDIEENQLTEGIGKRYLVRDSFGESHSSVFELEQKLSAWEKTISSHLKIVGVCDKIIYHLPTSSRPTPKVYQHLHCHSKFRSLLT